MRPRTISNEALLEAAARALSQIGPVKLTLAHVAREAGIAPATLVQRFGSKRGLLLALLQQGAEASGSMDAWRAAQTSPREALLAFAQCMAGMARSPQELANHLGFLVMDLTDEEFHRLTLAQAQANHTELTKWVQEGVDAGQLKPCDAAQVARLFSQTLHGALLNWTIFRQGDAESWVRREMEAFLKPYETSNTP